MKSKEELEKLLVVVDMVNGFVREGVMSSKNIEHIIPRIEELVKKAKENGDGVVFIKDTHNPDSLEFKKFPPHCLKGTSESELVSELKPYENGSLVYEKNSTSTMFAPGFMSDLEKMKKLIEVIVTGCCTDICVLNLVLPLTNYFDQNNRDVSISVYEDAVETYDAPNHNSKEYNEMSFKLLRQAGIRVR